MSNVPIFEGMKRKIIILTVIAILILIASAASIVLHRMVRQFQPESKVTRMTKAGIKFEDQLLPYRGNSIFVKSTGNPDSIPVLFIHGSPGYWSDWEHMFLDTMLRRHFHLISYDRPGYGRTTVPITSDLTDEAEVAFSIMQSYQKAESDDFIVVGHSYGGSIVEELMILHPEKIKKSVMVAALLNSAFHHPKWYNYLASFPLFKPLIPKPLRQSNAEMWSLDKELEENEKYLKDFAIPTVFIQGKQDMLVPYETAGFYRNYDSTDINFVLLEDLNHFTPWSHPHLIIQAIEERSY